MAINLTLKAEIKIVPHSLRVHIVAERGVHAVHGGPEGVVQGDLVLSPFSKGGDPLACRGHNTVRLVRFRI